MIVLFLSIALSIESFSFASPLRCCFEERELKVVSLLCFFAIFVVLCLISLIFYQPIIDLLLMLPSITIILSSAC